MITLSCTTGEGMDDIEFTEEFFKTDPSEP